MLTSRALFFGFACSLALAGCVAGGDRGQQQSGLKPAKPVELNRYLGRWYEIARFEASFQKDCDGVTADYSLRSDGKINVVNSCRQGGPQGPARSSTATARVVDPASNAKLKVAFFPPFEGDYWVLDHADDYSWSIVGEPSRKYLWLLSRTPRLSERQYNALVQRAAAMGYDVSKLRRTRH